MAGNCVFEKGDSLSVVCTAPTTPASGDPVLVGQLPGVALTNKNTTTNETTVQFCGVFLLSVQGETNSDAGSAVAVGDVIYYDAAETVKLNKDTTGVRFGIALGTVGSAATATIRVRVGY